MPAGKILLRHREVLFGIGGKFHTLSADGAAGNALPFPFCRGGYLAGLYGFAAIYLFGGALFPPLYADMLDFLMPAGGTEHLRNFCFQITEPYGNSSEVYPLYLAQRLGQFGRVQSFICKNKRIFLLLPRFHALIKAQPFVLYPRRFDIFGPCTVNNHHLRGIERIEYIRLILFAPFPRERFAAVKDAVSLFFQFAV